MSITHDKQPQELIELGAIRERLTASRTYYVRTDGSDSNDGLTNSAGGAFATIQKACDVVACDLDLNEFLATISIQAGTYNEDNIILREPLCTAADTGNSVRIEGVGSVILNSTGRNIEFATGPHRIIISNIEFQAINENIKISASAGVLRVADCTFTSAGTQCIFVNSLSKLVITTTSININVPSVSHFIYAERGAVVQLQTTTFTFGLAPVPSITSGLFTLAENSTAFLNTLTYVNSFTGRDYTLQFGSNVRRSLASDLDNIPGTLAPLVTDDSSTHAVTGLEFNNKISGFTLTSGIPGAAGFTGEGRYDDTADILYIYDGTTWNPH